MEVIANSILICVDEKEHMNTLRVVRKLRILSKRTLGMVYVICLGNCSSEYIEIINVGGAHKIIHGVSEQSAMAVCEKIIVENQIGLITFLDSVECKVLASMLATKLGGGLIADCIGIEYEGDGKYSFLRAAASDSVLVKIMCKDTKYQMCTIKKNSFSDIEDAKYGSGEVIEYYSTEERTDSMPQYKVVNREIYKTEGNNFIDNAKIVFGFGRGIKSPPTLMKLRELAERCSAKVGGTRASVEDRLIDEKEQIGQSGISISPNIYVAFGISGAQQHIVGLKNAKIIISINNNEHAPIFDYSDYVIIDNAEEIIEAALQIMKNDF